MRRLGLIFAVVVAFSGCGRATPFDKLSNPVDPFWKNVPGIEVPLLKQQMTIPNGGSNKYATIRAAYASDHVMVRISWEDETRNTIANGHQFADGAAVMFSPSAKTLSSPFMGDEKNPVFIWHWRGDWQEPAEQEAAFADSYPSYTDWAPPHEKSAFAELGRRPENGRAAMEYMAKGFGSLTAQPPGDVDARGAYDSEAHQWHVVFKRPIHVETNGDLQFDDKKGFPATIAVWDGGNGERGARKSVLLQWQGIRPAIF